MAIIRGGFLSAFLSVLETKLALRAFAVSDHGDGTRLAFLGHFRRGENRLTRRQGRIIVGLILEHTMGNKSNAASGAASMIFVCRLATAAEAGHPCTNRLPLGELVREQGVVKLATRNSDLAMGADTVALGGILAAGTLDLVRLELITSQCVIEIPGGQLDSVNLPLATAKTFALLGNQVTSFAPPRHGRCTGAGNRNNTRHS